MAYAATFIDREKTLIKGLAARFSRALAVVGTYLVDSLEAHARSAAPAGDVGCGTGGAWPDAR